MAKRRKKNRVKVNLIPLGRQRAVGQAYCGTNEIDVDFRVKPQFFLQIICHEICHLWFPSEKEATVDEFGRVLADTLHAMGFRRIYDENKVMSPRPKFKKKKNSG